MLINPAWFLRVPPPVRRIWRRPVEAAGAIADAHPVMIHEPLSEAGAVPLPLEADERSLATAASESALSSVATEQGHEMADTQHLAGATLASLTALRAADAEVAAPALLAAAKVHGKIDQAHLKLILQHLDEVGAPDEDRRYVLSHLSGPPDMQAMFSRVHDETTAQETYEMAATMIDQTKPAERDWLAALRQRLRTMAARFRG